MSMMSKIAALALALVASPALGQELTSPEGIWEISSRDSRYAVTLCGPDETSLCGTLIWLGRGAATAENMQYMHTMIIDHAPQIEDNRWRGTLHLFGQTATGAIQQVSDDVIELRGCAFFVICRTYTLHRF